MFIFKFCSLINLGMYVINKLFHDYFACTIFIHSLRETNSLASLVRLFYKTCEKKSYALTNRKIAYKYFTSFHSSP